MTNNSTDVVCTSAADGLAGFTFWVDGPLTALVIVLGVLGNALSFVVLVKRSMRSSTNVYLTGLSVWDTVVLLVTVGLICLPTFCRLEYFRRHMHAYFVCYVYPVGLTAQTTTIWLTVALTVERYIAVNWPLRAASICTIGNARIVSWVISILSVVYNVPRWFEYRASELPDGGVAANQTRLGIDETFVRVYYWLYVPLMTVIPLVSLSILNGCLISSVKRSRRQQRSMNVRQSRENNVTIMLVSVVIIFIICQVPALIYNIAYAIDRRFCEKSKFFRYLSVLRNFLVNVNSAINFLLYCAFGQKFRRVFAATFLSCCDITAVAHAHGSTSTTLLNRGIRANSRREQTELLNLEIRRKRHEHHTTTHTPPEEETQKLGITEELRSETEHMENCSAAGHSEPGSNIPQI